MMPSAIELVTIGTELLLGFTVDTNAAFLGQTFSAAGVEIVRRTSIADRPEEITLAVREALHRTGFVLTTGGLGPTRDDMSKQAVAKVFGKPLRFDETVWQAIIARYARRGIVPAESNRSQAMIPEDAVVLPNRWGTAPGLWIESALGVVIMLPGVPLEMRNLVEHEVLPRLTPNTASLVIRSATLRTSGIAESSLAERIGVLEDALAPLSLAYLPGVAGVDLRLTAWQLPRDVADAALAQGMVQLKDVAGASAYGTGDADLAEVVLEQLRQRGWKLAVAESCTGGLLGARMTEVPGSSDVFLGGVVAYDNRLKRELLGVPEAVLAVHGAVSAGVAAAMAMGVAARSGADVAVSVTGIAGPGGGTDEKPVGTVWFGFWVDGTVETHRSIFTGNRGEIRARAVQGALMGLRQRLRQ